MLLLLLMYAKCTTLNFMWYIAVERVPFFSQTIFVFTLFTLHKDNVISILSFKQDPTRISHVQYKFYSIENCSKICTNAKIVFLNLTFFLLLRLKTILKKQKNKFKRTQVSKTFKFLFFFPPIIISKTKLQYHHDGFCDVRFLRTALQEFKHNHVKNVIYYLNIPC